MYTRYSIHVLHLSILIDHVKWRYKIKELIVDLYSCVYTNVYKLVPAQCIQVKLNNVILNRCMCDKQILKNWWSTCNVQTMQTI